MPPSRSPNASHHPPQPPQQPPAPPGPSGQPVQPGQTGQTGQPRGAVTKESILSAALKLFAVRGIETVTIRDIADAAGVAEATVYRHYSGRDELVGELMNSQVGRFVLEMDELQARHAHSRDKMRAVIRKFYETYDREPDLLGFLLLTQHRLLHPPPNMPRPTNVIMWIIEQGQSRGEIRPGPLKVLAAMALGAIIEVPVARIYGSVRETLAPHADEVADGVWRMLAAG
jgi:AcrR family transcriptional regulator